MGALFVALVATSAAIATPVEGAGATNTAGLHARAAAIAASITADSATLESEGDRYLALSAQYESATAAARRSESHIGALKRQVADDSGSIRAAAIAAYVGDGSGSTVTLLLTGTPDDDATKTTYAEVATGDLSTAIASLHNNEIGLQRSLVTEEQEAGAAESALNATLAERQSALATLDAEQQVLHSVNTQIATLAEEEAAAAAARAEAAQQAAEVAQQQAAATAAAQAATTDSTTPSATTKPVALAAGPPAPAGVLAASSSSAMPSSLQGAFAAIRDCESGDDYALNTGNGYYGAYQFSASTWSDLGGSGLASAAAPAVQDAAAYRLYLARGWSSWPSCAVITGLR